MAEIYYAKSRKFTDYSQCVTDRRTGKQTEPASAVVTLRDSGAVYKCTDYYYYYVDILLLLLLLLDRQTDRKASSEADCSQQGHRRCCQSKGIM